MSHDRDGTSPFDTLWVRYSRERLDINELVDAVERRGRIQDVLSRLGSDVDRATALYVLSELSSRMVRPVWRDVVRYVMSDDLTVKFYCLDILHTFAAEASVGDFVLALRETNLSEPLLVGKLYSILTSCTDAVLAQMLNAAKEEGWTNVEHISGLQLLTHLTSVTDDELLHRLRSRSPVEKFYASCFVGRYRSHAPHLVSEMPTAARRMLETEVAHPSAR